MIQFTAIIKKFGQQGEKTGWNYIEITAKQAQQLKPNNKKSFRVKGLLDKHCISKAALLPMGAGNFILPLNATIRKGIGKRTGEKLRVQFDVDDEALKHDIDFIRCLSDEPKALAFFKTLPPSHQHYYSKWIAGAKTSPTKAKRIAASINGFIKKQGFSEMMRTQKQNRIE